MEFLWTLGDVNYNMINFFKNKIVNKNWPNDFKTPFCLVKLIEMDMELEDF